MDGVLMVGEGFCNISREAVVTLSNNSCENGCAMWFWILGFAIELSSYLRVEKKHFWLEICLLIGPEGAQVAQKPFFQYS